MKIYKGIFLFLSSLCITLLVSCTTTSASHSSYATPQNKPEYLFIVHAENGQLQRTGQAYFMVLNQPVITYFSDRPYRKVGHLNKQQFLNLWKVKFKNNFASDHPNAALAGLNYHPHHPKDADKATTMSSLMVLNNAQWDNKKQQLTIMIAPLDNKLTAGKLDDVVLFVDGTWMPGNDF